MTAPTRPPVYCDAIGGNDNVPPEDAIPWFIDNFVSQAKWFPDWLVDDEGGPLVRLAALGPRLIGFDAAGVSGEIEFSADGSGWLLAVARVGGSEVFRAYIERVYEEYEVWPPGAGAAPFEAEGGRIGKKASWISLRTEFWPILQPLANENGWLNMREDETRVRPIP